MASPHARLIARDVVGDQAVITQRYLCMPRSFGACYVTLTTSPEWLVAPTMTPSTSKAQALKAHAAAVRALVLDVDQAE